MKRLIILLLPLLMGCAAFSYFHAKYMHTSSTKFFYWEDGTKFVIAICDEDIRVCYDNATKECSGGYEFMSLQTEHKSHKYYIDELCRPTGDEGNLDCPYPYNPNKRVYHRHWYHDEYQQFRVVVKCYNNGLGQKE